MNPATRLVVHPLAIEEARAAYEWYNQRSESAARGFEHEFDAAIQSIHEAPGRWPLYASGTRRYLFRRYPFFIVYRASDTSILVLAVVHARRYPGYWRGRS